MTSSSRDGSDSRQFASVDEAVEQLRRWLEQVSLSRLDDPPDPQEHGRDPYPAVPLAPGDDSTTPR